MRIWKVGEKSRALCPSCDRLVGITYAERPVDLDKLGITVEGVLVSLCDVCGERVSIPAQSLPRLSEARRRKLKKLEVRMPKHLDDVLGVISERLHTDRSSFSPVLCNYYAAECSRSKSFANWARGLANDDLLIGKRDARLSLRLTEEQRTQFEAAESACEVESLSELVNIFILAGWHDVVQSRSSSRRKILASLAAFVR